MGHPIQSMHDILPMKTCGIQHKEEMDSVKS